MMKIIHLPCNNAYALQFGRLLIDVKGKTLWSTRQELLTELGYKTMREFNASAAA